MFGNRVLSNRSVFSLVQSLTALSATSAVVMIGACSSDNSNGSDAAADGTSGSSGSGTGSGSATGSSSGSGSGATSGSTSGSRSDAASGSTSGSGSGSGSSSGSAQDGGGDAATCSNPGGPMTGTDMHCATAAADGGARVQATLAASCCLPDSGAAKCVDDGGGAGGCPYGDTMPGTEGDDDDCKYHVKATFGPICKGSAGVAVKIVVTNKDAGSTSAAGSLLTTAEVFTTTPQDAGPADAAYCDNLSTHPAVGSEFKLTEGPAGTYSGKIAFDQAAQWTVRFHIHEECADLLPDSPHGHAAFFVNVN
jgi:hypothetical protein